MMKSLMNFVADRMVRSRGFFVLLMLPGLAYGQQTWEKDGGIPNQEIEIVKDRQITLPPADRIFEKIPPRPAEPIRPEIIYDFRNLKFSTPDFNPVLRPLKLKQEDLARINGNFLSAGYGNYSSPYLEAYFNSKRDKNKNYGMHFYHRSFANGPVDNNNSGNGTSEINGFGTIITGNVAVNGNLNYEDRSTFFYGYQPGSDPRRESIRQHFQDFSVGFGITNARAADFNYALQANYAYLTDHYKASEGELGLLFNSSYEMTSKAKFLIKADYYMMGHKDSIPGWKPRSLLRIRPSYYFSPVDKLWLTLGANVALANDTVGGQKSFHLYPHVLADYRLSDSFSLYASLTGDMDRVSLHTITRENLWINSNITLSNTNRNFEFLAGIKAKLANKVAFGAGFSMANLRNLYFYRNDVLKRSRFDVVYDAGNVQRENLFAELGFQQGEALHMTLRGDYFHYTTDRQPLAFHKPTYRVTFNSAYNLYSKIVFNVDLIAQGGMKTWDESGKTISIAPAADLNMKVEYLFSKSISAFVKLDNILSNNYQMYLYYPVRSFQVLGGVSWSF